MALGEEALELGMLLDSTFSIAEQSCHTESVRNHSCQSLDPEQLSHTNTEVKSIDTNTDEENSNHRKRTTSYTPWTLHRISLLGLLLVSVSLIVVLEVLYHVSKDSQGLATTTKNIHYLWTYGPTAGQQLHPFP